MTFVEKRNRLIYALSQAVGRPILLDSQTQPEVEPPFIIYSVMSDYETTGGSGNLALAFDETRQDTVSVREEQPTATFSLRRGRGF